MNFSDFFEQKKKVWIQTSGLRSLRSPLGLDFCSNDYLSFSHRTDLKERILKQAFEYPIGSGGSRLVRGHSDFLEGLENQLAQFSHQPSSLYLPSGYQANLALFSTLLKEKAIVFSDEKIHASIIDGIRLSGSEKYIWSHNQLDELEQLLRFRRKQQHMHFVVVESVYSMQGDKAPLKELIELCERYDTYLIVDEAHATGLYGQSGSGLVEEANLSERVFATIHTAGKALGVSGAWIAGSESLRELLVNQSRPFIFSTAPSFLQQMSVAQSLILLSEVKSEIYPLFFEKLFEFQNKVSQIAESFNLKVLAKGGPITSVLIGENQKALNLMNYLQKRNFDVRAIRPPAVPLGEALLRITLPIDRTQEEIESFCLSLEKGLDEIL